MLNKLGNIAWKGLNIFLILLAFSLVVGVAWVSIWQELLILSVMIMPAMIIFFGLVLSHQLEILAGSELYNTGIVHEGNSLIGVKKGPGYYKRKKYIDFLQVAIFLGYIIYFAFNIKNQVAMAVIGIVIFAICAFIYFVMGLSSIEKDKAINNKN
jgi:hypothetical protein